MTGTLKNKPAGCCCCDLTPDCTLLNDTFGSDTIADYNQVAGSWSISTGALRIGSSDAVILWDTELPAAHSLYVSGIGSVGANNLRYIVGWKDANNFLYLNIRNASYLSLWEVVAGTPNQLTAEVNYSSSNVSQDCLVCWLPSQNLLAYILTGVPGSGSNLGNGHATTADASNFGTYAGVGTGTIAAAEVSFSRMTIYSAGENCAHCFCNVCDVGTTPESITVEFDGVVNNGCDQCTLFNSTAFVLDRQATVMCQFSFANLQNTVDCPNDPYSPTGNYTQITGGISCDDTDTNADSYFTVKVRYYTGIVYRETIFQVRLGCCKLDCMAAIHQGLVVPPLTVGSYDDCDWSSATCMVTAVT